MFEQKVAIISNNEEYLDLMRELMREFGYQTLALTDEQDASDAIRKEQPDLVLLDVGPERDKAEELVLALLPVGATVKPIPIIICTTDARSECNQSAFLHQRPWEILLMPFDVDHLLEKVRKALSN